MKTCAREPCIGYLHTPSSHLYVDIVCFPPGYVGPGMLTAAVCGNVFASPPSSSVYDAIVRCTGPGNKGEC